MRSYYFLLTSSSKPSYKPTDLAEGTLAPSNSQLQAHILKLTFTDVPQPQR